MKENLPFNEERKSLKKSIHDTVTSLRYHFNNDLTKSFAFRQQQLFSLKKFIEEHETDMENALYEDLGKPPIESFATEIALVRSELKYTLKHLKRWMKPQKVKTNLAIQPGKSYVYPEPYGVVLIMAPWNYPILLMLVPLLGALAAGNGVVIKPSELAPATSHLVAKYLTQYIDERCLQIIEGDAKSATELLNEQFDYIFYTGNARVGRIVMTAAAKNLTPITLELGGKNPCVVDEFANLQVAARRIVWGKFSNAGQTCVAPDYLFVHADIENKLLDEMKKTLHDFFGEDAKQSKDYGRIINKAHFQRLSALLTDQKNIVLGGELDEEQRYIAPTILSNIKFNDVIMQEEIFGPILPIITFTDLNEVFQLIKSKPKPLAAHLFSNNNDIQKAFIEKITAGGICINHTIIHLALPELPFGGVGESGMGAYHGKTTFDTFSHRKAVLFKPTWLDPPFIYPPYTNKLRKILNWFL